MVVCWFVLLVLVFRFTQPLAVFGMPIAAGGQGKVFVRAAGA
jgi:hypothetical protein